MVSEKGVAESRCERRLKRNTKVSNALAEAYKSQEIRLFGENQGLKKRGKRSFFFFFFFSFFSEGPEGGPFTRSGGRVEGIKEGGIREKVEAGNWAPCRNTAS